MLRLIGDLDLKPLDRVFNYKYYSLSKLRDLLSETEKTNLDKVYMEIVDRALLFEMFRFLTVDYRSEHLVTGQIPHIPRWHYDLAANSQDNPGPGPMSVHYLAILTSTCSLTEFSTRGKIQSNKLYQYTNQDLHRASPAEEDGYRLFIRLSFSNHAGPQNIRKHNEY